MNIRDGRLKPNQRQKVQSEMVVASNILLSLFILFILFKLLRTA